MATTIKISALPAAVGIDGVADVLPIVQSGVTNKISRNTLLGLASAPLGLTDSQSVSNKTIGNTNTITVKDTLFTLQDDGDTTKQARFQLSGITTATTRTYTLPDITDSIVTLTATQTLTNKTLTAPTITGPSITGTVGGSATYSTVTLTTPTIASFVNATHNHSNAAGGGSTLTSPTINTAIISNPTLRLWDGWEDANETWTFSTSAAVTVPSDATTKYAIGDKVKLTQSASVKYFYITGVASTTLTLNGGTDYTVANSAISANAYSHVQTPLNFPASFNYTPTWTNLTVGNGTNLSAFSMNGRLVYTRLFFKLGSTSSVATNPTFTFPMTASTNYTTIGEDYIASCLLRSAGGNYLGAIDVQSTSVALIVALNSAGTYATQGSVTSTTPNTWATGDWISGALTYESA